MTENYNKKDIRFVLTEDLGKRKLLEFLLETNEFRPVFDSLPQDASKTEIIVRLIQYAERHQLIGRLLELLKLDNPALEQQLQPFEHEISSTRPSEPAPAKIIRIDNLFALLDEGFTEQEIRDLIFYEAEFRPVWEELTSNTPKAEIIHRLLEYVKRTSQVGILISLARERNPAKYKRHGPYYEDPSKLRLDAAVPGQVTLGRVFVLAVSVREPSSPVLDEKDLIQVRSGDVQVSWPENEPFINLRIEVSAPECKLHGKHSCSFQFYKDHDAPIFYFQLTPKKLGEISIVITVYQEDYRLGNARIHTVSYEEVGKVETKVTSHPLPEQDADIQQSTQTRDLAASNEVEMRKEEIRRLITRHRRRLQRRKEQQAEYGISADPHIPNEIEDIEAEIARLQAELNELRRGKKKQE